MNKKQLIRSAAKASGLSAKTVYTALAAIIETINKTVEQKEPVKLSGFGTFAMKQRKARKALIPTTRKTIQIPAKEVITFKASKTK